MKTFALLSTCLLAQLSTAAGTAYLQITDSKDGALYKGTNLPTSSSGSTWAKARLVDLTGAVPIDSWALGFDNSATFTTGSGVSSGKTSRSTFDITKRIDQWSPRVFNAIASGTLLPKVTIGVFKTASGGGSQIYQAYTLTNVVISSQRWSSGDGDAGAESLSFTYAAITVGYEPSDAKGAPQSFNPQSWSFTTNSNSVASKIRRK